MRTKNRSCVWSIFKISITRFWRFSTISRSQSPTTNLSQSNPSVKKWCKFNSTLFLRIKRLKSKLIVLTRPAVRPLISMGYPSKYSGNISSSCKAKLWTANNAQMNLVSKNPSHLERMQLSQKLTLVRIWVELKAHLIHIHQVSKPLHKLSKQHSVWLKCKVRAPPIWTPQ